MRCGLRPKARFVSVDSVITFFNFHVTLRAPFKMALTTLDIFAYTQDPIFPERIHDAFNRLWFIQSLLCMLDCLKQRRILPDPSPPTISLFNSQFRLHLLSHTIFYVVELVLTNMVMGFTNMACHHLVALGIFYSIWAEWNSISAVVILPFMLHAWLWVWSGGTSWFILSMYNWALLAAGLALLSNNAYYAAKFGKDAAPIRWMGLPGLCIFEVGVNAFTYCWSYYGKYCPTLDTDSFPEAVRLIGLISLTLAALVLPSIALTLKATGEI
ncbi:hypothetical protein DFS34DRAFT_371563 [Phlyctochytrium arcticum]|nr:hypothetical protein DFS34DRAFT_371563 [Phlyctochytrium arcticum]